MMGPMTPTHRRTSRPLAAAVAVSLVAIGALTGCSGGGDESKSPTQVLSAAKSKLDETNGVSLALSAGDIPDGTDALVDATGVGTHQPAFEGDLKMIVNNLTLKVPVIAVEGQVFAKLPFTSKYNEIDPGDYGAPDPADLMDSTAGISSWLTAVEDVKKGDQTRDGDKVLTNYTGTLPGSAVADVIPSATAKADFDATFSIDDDGYLAVAEVTGPFYGDAGDVDYTIKLDDYGTDKDITKP